VRDVTPVIHDPDGLQQIILKVLADIGIRTIENLHGYATRMRAFKR
jgi:hypothetical protein